MNYYDGHGSQTRGWVSQLKESKTKQPLEILKRIIETFEELMLSSRKLIVDQRVKDRHMFAAHWYDAQKFFYGENLIFKFLLTLLSYSWFLLLPSSTLDYSSCSNAVDYKIIQVWKISYTNQSPAKPSVNKKTCLPLRTRIKKCMAATYCKLLFQVLSSISEELLGGSVDDYCNYTYIWVPCSNSWAQPQGKEFWVNWNIYIPNHLARPLWRNLG